ncbi:MAG: hypothetical protein HC883_02320 [Bdellovibrionaceae bacterium]|nr:hypothetical protein [Pseudobdellovibrionaceae bacterium]
MKAFVETAKDYKVKVLVFPEYFTTQLLTLGDVGGLIADQIRNLAGQEERIVDTLSQLAKKSGIVIVGAACRA